MPTFNSTSVASPRSFVSSLVVAVLFWTLGAVAARAASTDVETNVTGVLVQDALDFDHKLVLTREPATDSVCLGEAVVYTATLICLDSDTGAESEAAWEPVIDVVSGLEVGTGYSPGPGVYIATVTSAVPGVARISARARISHGDVGELTAGELIAGPLVVDVVGVESVIAEVFCDAATTGAPVVSLLSTEPLPGDASNATLYAPVGSTIRFIAEPSPDLFPVAPVVQPEWRVDGVVVGVGPSINQTFDEAGTYLVVAACVDSAIQVQIVDTAIDFVEATSDPSGNTVSGPGSSALNPLIVCSGARVDLRAVMAPQAPGPPENRGVECLTWEVVHLPLVDPSADTDGDGILDGVDTLPSLFSDGFSDAPLGGSTGGDILERAGRRWLISDAPGTNDGIRVIVSSGPEDAIVETTLCEHRITITIPAGVAADFEFTCASTEFLLNAGQIQVVCAGLDTVLSATLDEPGAALTFDIVNGDTLVVAVDPESTGPVGVDVDGEGIDLEPGEQFDVPFTPDTDRDGVADAVDACPDSDVRSGVFIAFCDTGVANRLFADGCTLADRFADLLTDKEVKALAKALREEGLIDKDEEKGIKECADAVEAPVGDDDDDNLETADEP